MKEVIPDIVPQQFNFDKAMLALQLAAFDADAEGQTGLAHDFRVAADLLFIFKARSQNGIPDPNSLNNHPEWIQKIALSTLHEISAHKPSRGTLNEENKPAWLEEF